MTLLDHWIAVPVALWEAVCATVARLFGRRVSPGIYKLGQHYFHLHNGEQS